ncbi:MAG TPA: Rne/Rng family ribonuclease [Saprospiraceae bacterium]|nr:Rne/Rng family ribonuclease [Saprospiraceae bacterium]HMU02052.1 Rne/Rng family ribonuclease [Saprospiraceae bacterium]
MDKELIIKSTPTDVEIALVEGSKLVEIHRQKTNNNSTVGDIFLGSAKKLMPGLNAGFIDIGHRKDAFLHYTDLGPQIKSLIKYTNAVMYGNYNSPLLENFQMEPDNPKTGKIDQVFDKNTHVLVQVLKEPISTKGPRLSCELTLPGRYVVLTPFSEIVAVSKKIASAEERKRLKVLVESIKPKNFGVIVRTAAEGKKVADLHNDIRELEDKWKTIFSQLKQTKTPDKILSEIDKTSSILRDILNDNFNKIIVDDKEMYESLKDYLGNIAPDRVKILQHYRGSRHIFDNFDINRQIKASFGKTSTMSSGAYIVIEHTEAMHVIDVNSGPKMQRKDQEDAALAVNLEAAEEIARQLRLRDIGGLVIIDFIDMKTSENKVSLFNKMRDFMESDRAQHTILPLSKFGLMQITRQRSRPEVNIDTRELCPSCQGTGKVNPTILVIDNIQRDIEYIINSRPQTKLRLQLNQFVYAYLKNGLPSIQMKWWMKYKKWIKMQSDANFHLFEYKFFDETDDEIRLT